MKLATKPSLVLKRPTCSNYSPTVSTNSVFLWKTGVKVILISLRTLPMSFSVMKTPYVSFWPAYRFPNQVAWTGSLPRCSSCLTCWPLWCRLKKARAPTPSLEVLLKQQKPGLKLLHPQQHAAFSVLNTPAGRLIYRQPNILHFLHQRGMWYAIKCLALVQEDSTDVHTRF